MQLVKSTYRSIFGKYGYYLMFFLVSSGIANLILIPIFTLIGNSLLKISHVDYLSNANFFRVITLHPILDIALLGLGLLVMISIYWQVTFWILGLNYLGQNHVFKWHELLQSSLIRAWNTWYSGIAFLGINLIILLPLNNWHLLTPLLRNVKFPAFFIEYMLHKNQLLLLVIFLGYIILFYLAIRWCRVLPLIILKNQSGSLAEKTSWKETQVAGKSIFGRLFLLVIFSLFSMLMIRQLTYNIQLVIDQTLPKSIAGFSAWILLLIIESGWILTKLALIIGSYHSITSQTFSSSILPLKTWWINLIITSGLLILLGFNALYLGIRYPNSTLQIAHRGVNTSMDVPNSITALKKTSQLNPDFIEMDLRETRDHQFAVVHDDDLEELTGHNLAPHQLTLKQITNLNGHAQNRHKAPIASFDHYLDIAEKLNQPLLIELKTEHQNVTKMVKHFNQKYGRRILNDHDQVHSLDERAVDQLKTLNPKLKVGYVIPVSFLGVPQKSADFYSMETVNLNPKFLLTAKLHRRPIYGWTINQPTEMAITSILGIDGIITDRLSKFQQTNKSSNFASRLWLY